VTNDVIVVGAGPTGLAAACALRAAGVGVRVLDAAAGPAVTSRALGVQPRGVEVLDRLGALGDLPERALPILRAAVNIDGRQIARLELGQPTRLRGPRALIISQADIEGAMSDRLAELDGSVEWARPVTGLDADPDGVTLHLGDGSELRADWVIGADGAHSAIRKSAGIGFPGAPIEERFLLADVHADIDRPRDGAHTWLRGKALLAAFPLPGAELWRLMAPAPADAGAVFGQTEIVEFLASRLASEAGGTVHATAWTSTFRIQRRLADTYRRGRVLLAGDAAHIHSPFGGQGMNTGIADAENLAWKLALVVDGRADEDLLDTYEAERRPIAKDVVGTTSELTEMVLGHGRAARLLRDRVAIPLVNQPWLQRLIAEKSSQLQVSYRSGPLGAGHRLPFPRGPRPGDRVPDRPCVGEVGVTIRLYDALGPQWALIGPDGFAELARTRLDDVVALRGDGEAMLIRPDGHLAWRGSDSDTLRPWLDRVLSPSRAVLTR
jgi:2-polyprenyl-6-methoxyphenol hydroxylase-like FAD-dependent oxidoreductase